MELSTLLEAGVDIRTALELIRDHQTKKRYLESIDGIITKIINGSTFSNALQISGKYTLYEYFSVKIGEETGKLIVVLKELSLYFKNKIKQRRQIIGALAYPFIILLVAIGAVWFMITFVVPMFSDVFKRFGGDLPFTTKMIVKLSSLMKEYSLIILLIIALFLGVILTQRKKEIFRHFTSSFILKIPVVKQIISKIYLARFANTMALLLSSHIPILQSIQMARRMVGFYPIEKSLIMIEENILVGIPLHTALSRHDIYPKKLVAMLKVGENVNQLDKFFRKIHELYIEEVEYQTSLISKFIEPLIIIFLGLIVGTILIAMYLPLFKLGQGI